MENITPEEASRFAQWVARHPRGKRSGTCTVCGKLFVGGPRRKYCGGTCAVRAYRERQKQQAATTVEAPPVAGESL